MNKKIGMAFAALSICFIIAGLVFCSKGFDKKNKYHNSEDYSSLNINSYVGGDAYNYIINGTYFTGYCMLGGSMFVSSAVCAGFGAYFIIKDESTKVKVVSTVEATRANPEDELPDL